MIRLILSDGTWFAISPDSYHIAVAALDPDAPDTIDLNMVAGGSILVKSSHVAAVTRQTEAELKSAWEHEAHLENMQKEVDEAMTPDWE